MTDKVTWLTTHLCIQYVHEVDAQQRIIRRVFQSHFSTTIHLQEEYYTQQLFS